MITGVTPQPTGPARVHPLWEAWAGLQPVMKPGDRVMRRGDRFKRTGTVKSMHDQEPRVRWDAVHPWQYDDRGHEPCETTESLDDLCLESSEAT